MFKIICRVEPASWFGLPDGDKIVLPKGDILLKQLIQSSSDIWFKVSNYRNVKDSISFSAEGNNFKLEFNENFVIFYCEEDCSNKALDYCQSMLNVFIRVLQTKYKQNFKYEFVEMYIDNVLEDFPKTGFIKDVSLIVYDLQKLQSSLKYAVERMGIDDKTSLRFLEYFDRAMFLEEIYNQESSKKFNLRYSNFLCTEIFLNYFKSLTVILGDPSIDKDYQSRYKRYGYNQIFFEETLEYFRKIRNENDVSHYSLKDDYNLYINVKNNLPKIKEVACDVFEKHLKYKSSLDNPR